MPKKVLDIRNEPMIFWCIRSKKDEEGKAIFVDENKQDCQLENVVQQIVFTVPFYELNGDTIYRRFSITADELKKIAHEIDMVRYEWVPNGPAPDDLPF